MKSTFETDSTCVKNLPTHIYVIPRATPHLKGKKCGTVTALKAKFEVIGLTNCEKGDRDDKAEVKRLKILRPKPKTLARSSRKLPKKEYLIQNNLRLMTTYGGWTEGIDVLSLQG